MWRAFALVGAALMLMAAPASAFATGADGYDQAAGDQAARRSPSPAPPSDGAPPVTVATGADARWHAGPVTVTFIATGETAPVADTFVQVDGGAPVASTEVLVRAPRDHDNDGIHTLTYWSVDVDGRTEIPQSLTVKVDTQPPVIRDLSLRPSLLHQTQPVRVRFALADISGGATVSYSVLDQYGYLARRAGGVSVNDGSRTLKIPTRYGNHRAFDPGLFRTTLTFDDGGPAWVWGRMLDTLKAYKMHATFFVIGPYVSAAPAMARRTAQEGHGIGSHGWTHSEMTRQGYSGVRNELIRSEAPWWRAAQATPVGWVRPPYGSHNRTTVAAAGSAGFKRFIMWDVDPGDWRGYGASTIAANTLSHVHSGAIVGLHVRPTTMAALPAILRGLRARGYTSVSLPELFHAAGRR